ncbi:MAG: hypothetical protein OEZ02_12590 [Anaerolineae bacterium]|nr:hypothetical protein [Anaerolineae bacterium]
MKVILSGLLILGAAAILQTTIIPQIPLLNGTADLVLLVLLSWILRKHTQGAWQWALIAGAVIGLASALPFWIPLASYLLITFLAQWIQQRIWQVPILTLLIITFIGTLIIQIFTTIYLLVSGTNLPIGLVFNQIILPSMILNIILVLPVYSLMGEIIYRLYPSEVEL